jgi:hypothetical protein
MIALPARAQPGSISTPAYEHDLDGPMTLGEFPGPPGSPYHPAHPEHHFAAGRAFSEAGALSAPVRQLLNDGAPVAEVEPLAREAFASMCELSHYARWAFVAGLGGDMLRAHLQADEPDTEAVAFYTRHLLDQDSPNAIVLAAALDHLEGAWSAKDVAEARERAASVVLAEPGSGDGPLGGVQTANAAAARYMQAKARAAAE